MPTENIYTPSKAGVIKHYRDVLAKDGIDSSKVTDQELFAIYEYWKPMKTKYRAYNGMKSDVQKGIRR